jgi:hypothetical protein
MSRRSCCCRCRGYSGRLALMNTDPVIVQIAVDSADAAQLVAAMANHDHWEWQAIFDGIEDVEHAKRLLAALGGLYVSHVQSVAGLTGRDAADWLHELALEQIHAADQTRGAS